jgi:hypothetical protein
MFRDLQFVVADSPRGVFPAHMPPKPDFSVKHERWTNTTVGHRQPYLVHLPDSATESHAHDLQGGRPAVPPRRPDIYIGLF